MTKLRCIPLFLILSVLCCGAPKAQSDSAGLNRNLASLDKKMSSMQKDLSRSITELDKARKGLKKLDKERKRAEDKAEQIQKKQAKEIATLRKELKKCKQSFEGEIREMTSEVVRLREARAEDARKVAKALQRNHSELGTILATATNHHRVTSQQAPRRRRCSPSRSKIATRVREEMTRRANQKQAKVQKKINEE